MDEAIIKRTMPHSVEAEQSVIGSMLISNDAIQTASEIITGDDFYLRRYGCVFDALVELFNERKAVDVVTLQNRLREKNVPPDISDMSFIKELTGFTSTSVNVADYAEIVKRKAILRQLIKVSDEIQSSCYADSDKLSDILDESERKVFEVCQKKDYNDIQPVRQIVSDSIESIEKASKSKGIVTGIPTGFTDLDYKTAGLHESDLIFIAARPSMGKTALALNMAEYMAVKKKKSVAIFSLEMSSVQLMNRLISMNSKVNSQNIRTGDLKEDEWSRLITSAGELAGSNIMIDQSSDITVAEMRSKCRRFKFEHGLDAVFIDYLQLIKPSVKGADLRTQVSDITRSLKILARELNVPIVVLSQLSRGPEQRTDHRPMLSDLRESGSIEQDADIVMFIYRDDYYNFDSEDKGIAEIIIAKQRNGPVGTVKLLWQAEYTKFANLVK